MVHRFATRRRFCCALALGAMSAAEAAGTLTYCMDGAPQGFDIAQYETGPTFDAAGIALYDQLTALVSATGQVVPQIAESWTISTDGLVYTLKLRRGVKFHSTPWFKPSRDLNAQDVLFSIQRMWAKNHWAHAAARNGFVYWESMGMSTLVKAVDQLDSHTLRFTLSRPDAPFLASLAVPTIGSVYSAEYAEQLQRAGKLEQLNTQPVGSGPFIFRSYQKDAVIRYSANTAYWAGAPKIDALVIAITADPDVRVQRLMVGECLVAPLKNESAAQFTGNASVVVQTHRPLRTDYLAPNTERRHTADKRLREAMRLAIDKATLVRAHYGGSATPAASFLPAQMWGRDTTLENRHDPAKARELVKASGYDGTELALFLANDTATRRAGELIQADLDRVGVKVRLQTMDLGELYKRTSKGEHDLALLSWESDNGDPDNFFTPNLACAAVAGGGNKARWCNPAFDSLLDSARRTTDVAQRTAFYARAERLLYDEVAVIPTAYPQASTGVNRRVQGYVPSPFGLHDFRAVSVK